MREYETWEVIKMLGENPKLRFKPDSESNEIYMKDGILTWSNGAPFILNVCGYALPKGGVTGGTIENYKWTLVRTPVTWQEAIQAWSEGKIISCEQCRGGRDGNCGDCRLSPQVFDQKGDCLSPICREQLKTGTWYIGDPDAM